ncbi:MAG: DMT family transporter [Planctomycetes bacterium]|nr:DMT family transporter [Planctomycetota bacterium]
MDRSTRLLLVAVQVCFGVFPLLGKVAMGPGGLQPRALLVWRLLVGTTVLMAIAVARHRRAALPSARDLAALFGLSILGVTLNQLLFLEGLSRSTAVNAGLLMTVIPVATLALAALFGKERLTLPRVLGIALSVTGVAWLFLHRGAAVGAADTSFGDLLMTTNAVSYSAYLVLAKPLLARLPRLVVIAWVFAFGALTAPWFALDVDWAPASTSATQWAAVVGVVLLPTILAYLGNIVVLARTHASTTAAYVVLQPFVAAGLGMAVLGERPEPALAVTAVCVIGGLWLVSIAGRRAAARAAAAAR